MTLTKVDKETAQNGHTYLALLTGGAWALVRSSEFGDGTKYFPEANKCSSDCEFFELKEIVELYAVPSRH